MIGNDQYGGTHRSGTARGLPVRHIRVRWKIVEENENGSTEQPLPTLHDTGPTADVAPSPPDTQWMGNSHQAPRRHTVLAPNALASHSWNC